MKNNVFRATDGRLFLVRCPRCKALNYVTEVETGRCCWCKYKATIKDVEEYK